MIFDLSYYNLFIKKVEGAEEMYDNDWDFEHTEEPEDKEPDIFTNEVFFYPADLTLKGFWDKWKSGQLEIPDFQRAYVWDKVRASKLIESFLLGLPVPGVFLYKDQKTNHLHIIDGQQRIMTAIRYFQNEFEGRDFRLSKVQPRWDNKSYSKLEEPDRIKIDDAVLRATIIQEVNPDNRTDSIYLIFERLNTGGVNLTPMEIRKCIYFGDFFQVMERINRNEDWRKILGKSPDKRLNDVELILRVLALAERADRYKKPMKLFLNEFMRDINDKSEEKKKLYLEFAEKTFYNTCSTVVRHLGEKPFHYRKDRLNFAILDSTLSLLVMNGDKIPPDLGKRFNEMLKDGTYIESISMSTSDERTMTARLGIAKDYLLS